MKIFKINLFVLCCIFAVAFSSCEKDNYTDPASSSDNAVTESRQRNDDFFNSRKTYERLRNTAHNWSKDSQASLRSDDEDVDELKDYVDDLNILLNDKYVNKIIADEGYPL